MASILDDLNVWAKEHEASVEVMLNPTGTRLRIGKKTLLECCVQNRTVLVINRYLSETGIFEVTFAAYDHKKALKSALDALQKTDWWR